jgi:two-component system NtrC family response regulator
VKGIDKNLLVVEDDVGLQSQLRWCFDDYEVAVAGDRSEGISLLRRHNPPVVLLDLGLPPDPGGATEGIAVLEEILAIAPETKVIVITGNNTQENAVQCIGLGAYDFYPKPIDPDTLKLVVERAYRVHELELENKKLLQSSLKTPLDGIIATSPQMLSACRMIEKVAPSDVTTLLLGESGTGKELFARALHELSSRAGQKLVSINCAAIPANLLESELFGYEKGAFTGAVKQTRGKIEYADNGTLFLDEVGDLPMELQPKLLRFLQERVFERIGGRQEISVDIRIVCATHQNLQALIDEGRFREDLYYRISELSIQIPPLRERQGDILVLARAFLNKFNSELGRSISGFSKSAVAAMESHPWPGNVREIESRIKRAVILADGNQIGPEDLELSVSEEEPLPFNLKQVREEAEKQAIIRALNHSGENVSQAAKLLGVTRPTLYNMMEKHSLNK